MEHKIITISREFGSGGRSIGKALAERLGITYYDKELVKQMAVQSGFTPDFIEERGESAPMKNKLAYLFSGMPAVGTPDVMKGLSTYDYLWLIQRQVILELAEKESCVIIGRCADFILQDRTDCFHTFIHADTAFRAERIVRLYGETDKSPEKRLEEKDAKRRINYKHFTGREWGMAQNYHLSLNSSIIGIERCVDIIANLV